MSKKHEPGMAYDMKKLNKIFAIFSLVLLVTVIWVFLDDYLRPWKAIQVEAMKIEKEKIAKDIAEEEAKISKEKLERLMNEGMAAIFPNSKYPVYKHYLDPNKGAPIDNLWNIQSLGTSSPSSASPAPAPPSPPA